MSRRKKLMFNALMASGAVVNEPFSQETLPNKTLWLREEVVLSGSDVTTWTDKYNSNDCSASAPVPDYSATGGSNSRSKLTFIRANTDKLIGTNLALSSFTFIMVFKADNITNNQAIFYDGYNGTSFGNGFLLRINASTIGVQIKNTSGSNEQTVSFSDTTSWHVLTIRYNRVGAGTSNLNVKLDLVEQISNTAAPLMRLVTENYRIGGTTSANTPSIQISEIIITSSYLSDENTQKIENYLLDYYAITPVFTNFNTVSTIDASVTGLNARISFDTNVLNAPLIVLVAGWEQAASDFDSAVLPRWRDRGFFAMAVNMRGRGGATGSRDASARELHDIYDLIQKAKSLFSIYINANKISIVGYSGGGGNVLGLASKFPDLASNYVDFFGISDYGYDGTYGWYQQEPTRQSELSTSIGDTPTNMPNEYKSRQHMFSASNCKGYIWLFHHETDASVHLDHTTRTVDQLDADGFTNYTENITLSGASPPRWIHGLPNGTNEVIDAEPLFSTDCLNDSNPTMPTSGTLKINGYLKCSLFTLWLGNGTAAQDGKNRRATLTYNYSTNSYTLVPSIDSPDTDLTYTFIDNLGRTSSGTISSSTGFTPM
jgi:pimeloyl-ACP methyl ester carboxylesterase